MDKGWIKLHRKTLESRVFQNEGLLKVWVWCLLKANHEEQWVSVRTGRGISEVRVSQGQFIFGRKSAAKELKMSPSTVWKRMHKLEKMRNCDIKSDRHYSLVTIVNWELYQTDEKKVTVKVTGKEQASDTNKNDKNVKTTSLSGKKPDPDVRTFVMEWEKIWTQKFGRPYMVNWGKDGKIAKDMLRVYSLHELREIRQEFFTSQDPFIKGSDYSIGVFKSVLNKLVVARENDPVEEARQEMRRARDG